MRELSELQAKELLLKLRLVPEHPLPETPPASQDELNKLIEKYAKQYQLDAAVLRKGSERNAFRAAKLAEELAQRVAEHIPAVAKAVGSPPRKDTEACRVAKQPASY